MNPAPVAKPTTPLRMSICPRYWGMLIPMSSVWPCARVGARPKAPGKGLLEPELWWARNQDTSIRTWATKETGETEWRAVIRKRDNQECLEGENICLQRLLEMKLKTLGELKVRWGGWAGRSLTSPFL